MPDPNARRDKALETIARELAEINRHLRIIANNGKQRSVDIFNTYQQRSESAISDGSEPATDEGTGDPEPREERNATPYT